MKPRVSFASWLVRVVREHSSEWLRLLSLLGYVVWLLWPYCRAQLTGGIDACAYLCNLADAVTQVRNGHFPIWLHQTFYGYLGSYYPIRFAPLYQHLGMILDGLTFHQLGFPLLDNLELIGCGLSGLFLLYGALRLIQPTRGWLCWAVTVIFLNSPGVYGLLVINDMNMSWTAVAFMPLFFYGMIRSATKKDLLGGVLQVLGLGLIWWAHSPIAMWCTVLGTMVYLVSFPDRVRSPKLLLLDGCLALVFITLISFPVISYFSVLEHGVQPPSLLERIQTFISPGNQISDFEKMCSLSRYNWLPFSSEQRHFKQGYSLLLLLLLALFNLRSRPTWPKVGLTFCCLIYLCLLFPVPLVSKYLYVHLPSIIWTVTKGDTEQRLNAIVAQTICFMFIWFLPKEGSMVRSRYFNALIMVSLLWSFTDAVKMRSVKLHQRVSASITASVLSPENTYLGNLSIVGAVSNVDRYRMNSYDNPEMQLRLLTENQDQIAWSNIEKVAPGFGPASASVPLVSGQLDFQGVVPKDALIRLTPTLELRPGAKYLLPIKFNDPDGIGELSILGKNFHRLYRLPYAGCFNSEQSRAFGSKGDSSRCIPLMNSTAQPLELTFYWNPKLYPPKGTLVHVAKGDLIQYESANLPFQLLSFDPLRIKADLPTAGWLETFRSYMRDYVAKVDGQVAPTQDSRDSLLLVEIPKGRHTVEVTYVVPRHVEIAYYANLLAFVSVFSWLGLLLRNRLLTGGVDIKP